MSRRFSQSTVSLRMFCLTAVLILAGRPCPVSAQSGSPAQAEYDLQLAHESSPDLADSFSMLLRDVLLEALDEDYVDEKNWGQTTRRWDGFRTRGLRFSKRTKEVQHGIWRRYVVSLIRPEKSLKVRLEQLPPREDGSIPIVIRASLRARVKATGVIWSYGVKGWNGSAVSDVDLSLKLLVSLLPNVEFSWSAPLPRIDLRPRIEDLRISLDDVDLRRIGIFEGPAVELIGDGSRKAVEEMVRQQESRIRRRLNQKLSGPREKTESALRDNDSRASVEDVAETADLRKSR